jgi:hypothetical protein
MKTLHLDELAVGHEQTVELLVKLLEGSTQQGFQPRRTTSKPKRAAQGTRRH